MAKGTQFLRNNMNAVVTITFGDGVRAFQLPRRGSVKTSDLPQGFLELPEVIKYLEAHNDGSTPELELYTA
ncbi:hypothetical protein KW797_01680 [Candidatus Parcubacteria bacterium]|nr:hypothetical protein [Candidatus Parcubacteria bacterium]